GRPRAIYSKQTASTSAYTFSSKDSTITCLSPKLHPKLQTPSDTRTAVQQEFANDVGAISVYPYAGGSLCGGVANVIAQGMTIPTGATATALNAIALAAQNHRTRAPLVSTLSAEVPKRS